MVGWAERWDVVLGITLSSRTKGMDSVDSILKVRLTEREVHGILSRARVAA